MRRFEPPDAPATAPILYESSGEMYDRYAGSRVLAVRAITRALERDGTTGSADVVWVAESADTIAGAMAAMPWHEWSRRASAFLRVALSAIPPWRWPRAIWMHHASGRSGGHALAATLYVDSLATAPAFRRRGVATALLDAAEQRALERGLRAVALDAWEDNSPARALYRSRGFIEVAHTPAARGLPGGVSLVKQLG